MSSEELPIQPKGYNLLRFNLVMRDEYDPDAQLSETDGGEDLIDLRKVCSGWNYIESINSPSVRMEFAIYDTLDLISTLTGNELIQLTIETDSAPDQSLEIEQRIFKIGNVVKSERAVAYMIYTVSPETHRKPPPEELCCGNDIPPWAHPGGTRAFTMRRMRRPPVSTLDGEYQPPGSGGPASPRP